MYTVVFHSAGRISQKSSTESESNQITTQEEIFPTYYHIYFKVKKFHFLSLNNVVEVFPAEVRYN
jgi:hypothetical protein